MPEGGEVKPVKEEAHHRLHSWVSTRGPTRLRHKMKHAFQTRRELVQP